MEQITAYFGKVCSTSSGIVQQHPEENTNHSYSAALSKNGNLLKNLEGLKVPLYERIFTRHFYNRGEVCSALMHALLAKKIEESSFWCLELIDSEEYDAVLETIFKTYIQYMQPTASWLHSFIYQIDNFTTEGCLWLCIDFATLNSQISSNTFVRNKSYFNVDANIVHWFNICAKEWFIDISFTREQYIQYMIQCGIEGEMTNTVRSIDIYLPHLATWALQTGRRVRRRWFAIPYNLRHIQSTLTELYGIQLNTLLGCPYYDRIFECCGYSTIATKNVFSMDEDEEDIFQAMHTQIFPDDIPDEWSLQDQMQSHGTLASTNGTKQL